MGQLPDNCCNIFGSMRGSEEEAEVAVFVYKIGVERVVNEITCCRFLVVDFKVSGIAFDYGVDAVL